MGCAEAGLLAPPLRTRLRQRDPVAARMVLRIEHGLFRCCGVGSAVKFRSLLFC
jgi:hypothetical protein